MSPVRHDAAPMAAGRRIALVLVGPSVWAAHLLVAYLGGALYCRSEVEGQGGRYGRITAAHPFIVVATLVAAALLVAALAATWSRRRRTGEAGDDLDVGGSSGPGGGFVDALAVGVNGFALAAVLLEGLWAWEMAC